LILIYNEHRQISLSWNVLNPTVHSALCGKHCVPGVMVFLNTLTAD